MSLSDTGASGFYLTPKSPCTNINPDALRILVGTNGGLPHRYSVSWELLLSNLSYKAGHIMPHFHHNLMGIGPICEQDCQVVFEKKLVMIYSRDNYVLLSGWQESSGYKLCKFALCPKGQTALSEKLATGTSTLNAHNFTLVGALVWYMHACADFPVCSTWISATNAGNLSSWPCLNFANSAKYWPVSI